MIDQGHRWNWKRVLCRSKKLLEGNGTYIEGIWGGDQKNCRKIAEFKKKLLKEESEEIEGKNLMPRAYTFSLEGAWEKFTSGILFI